MPPPPPTAGATMAPPPSMPPTAGATMAPPPSMPPGSERNGDRAATEFPPYTLASPVGGPVSVAWREGTLTRAHELETLCEWVGFKSQRRADLALAKAIRDHLEAARQAARAEKVPSKRFCMFRNGPLIERATSNLDAAEALLLNIAPASYVLGQMPSLLRHVQRHLPPTDPGRQEFERIARSVGINDLDRGLRENGEVDEVDADVTAEGRTICRERGKIAATVRAASSAALREHVRLRSFRNIVVITAVFMSMLAIGLGLTGFFYPALIPLCFAPEESGQAIVVCPTEQSGPFIPLQANAEPQGNTEVLDIDFVIEETAKPADLIIVELIGLTAAAIATAAAISHIKGSSERYGLPVALAALKLPTGAVTAFLGLLLMRGQFIPGLSALDNSAQILAWALVFGYAQQLFTRLVDQQGQSVLNSVRAADSPERSSKG